MQRSTKDEVALYQLWRRARYQKLAQEGFIILRRLKNEQPQNAKVLTVYCMAIEQQSDDTGKARFQATPQEMKVEMRRANIEKIKEIDPKLWIAYSAQGRFESNTDPMFDVNERIRIYGKALKLAPNLSSTNGDYSNALTELSFKKKTPYTSAIRYKEKAQKLAPLTCEPSLGLIMMYRWRVPNDAKEQQAAQAYLATIPPKTKLTPEWRKYLAQWGVKVPWR